MFQQLIFYEGNMKVLVEFTSLRGGLLKLQLNYQLYFVDDNNNIYYSNRAVAREEAVPAQDLPNGLISLFSPYCLHSFFSVTVLQYLHSK